MSENRVLKKRPKLTAFEHWAYDNGIYDDASMFMSAYEAWYAARGKPVPDFIRNPQNYEVASDDRDPQERQHE